MISYIVMKESIELGKDHYDMFPEIFDNPYKYRIYKDDGITLSFTDKWFYTEEGAVLFADCLAKADEHNAKFIKPERVYTVKVNL